MSYIGVSPHEFEELAKSNEMHWRTTKIDRLFTFKRYENLAPNSCLGIKFARATRIFNDKWIKGLKFGIKKRSFMGFLRRWFCKCDDDDDIPLTLEQRFENLATGVNYDRNTSYADYSRLREIVLVLMEDLGYLTLKNERYASYEEKSQQAKKQGYRIIGTLETTKEEIWKKTRK